MVLVEITDTMVVLNKSTEYSTDGIQYETRRPARTKLARPPPASERTWCCYKVS